jgi:hypothetical protein
MQQRELALTIRWTPIDIRGGVALSNGFVIDQLENTVRTEGLSPEVMLRVDEESLLEAGEAVLRRIVSDGRSEVDVGYWIVRLVEHNGLLEVCELEPGGRGYRLGASTTVRYWLDQHAECAERQSNFVPPAHDHVAAVSPGVFDGGPVEGVRYAPEGPLSGWWLMSNDYDLDTSSGIHPEHLFHVTDRRPDIARYLALEPGFCFSQNSGRVWFDDAVLNPDP